MNIRFENRRNPNAQVLSRVFDGTSYLKLRRYLLSVLMTTFLSGCGIYSGGFQRGGDLTSNFLERIQENPKDQEDQLLPKQKTNNNKEAQQCSKRSQK